MTTKIPAPKHSLDELWQNLAEEEAQVVSYLAYATSPISLDDLVSLSGAPAVRVLRVMEELRARRFVFEKKESGKGIYFLNCGDLSECMQRYQPENACRIVIKQMLEFYSQSMPAGDARTLILAELYYQYDNQWEGAQYIKLAADILYRAGQNEKAVVYYDHLLKTLNNVKVQSESVDYYLDGVLGKIAAAKHLMPIPEQIAILTTAEKLAKRYEKWEHLSKIKLAMGHELQAAGQSAKALRYVKGFWKLAEKSGDPRMLKMATLLMSEYLHWKGKFSEVIQRYEEVVENLEEFGEDEATLKASARVGLCYVRCGRIARGMGMIEAIRLKAQMLNLQHVVIFTHLMTMLSLFEIRQIPEAEKCLDTLLSFPEDAVGHYILAPVFICKAYVLCQKDDDRGAEEYLERYLKHVNFVGWPHQNAAWNFEFLDLMESKGIAHQDWNYDAEIKRVLGWDDIYMKGVSYRYRAIRSLKNNHPYGKILADLKSSEKYLKRAGAELELARTRIALGNLCLQRGETRSSQAYLEKAWSLFSKVDKSLFPKDLLGSLPQEQKIELMVDRMISINESLGTVKNMSAFLERVLNLAMDFAMAMRGAFFVVNSQGVKTIAASRNLDPLLLKADQFKVITAIVNQTAEENMEIIIPGLDGNNGIDDDSLPDASIHSLICMPVKLGEEVHGYLYLDNRFGGRPFSENHLPFIRLICSQVAVGLSNIKAYDEMRETKNRIEDEAIFYKREMGIANPNEMIIGTSDGVKRVLEGIRQVAPTDSSVLIMGETGVGKELVAKAIHNMSKRCNGPFIPVNLAALPADLVASELFGHEKGAFTGANETNKGRFELAHGGTIFLDEIGDLPSIIQVKLLRVLQEGTFERLGSAKPIRSDFRVIAATNKDLYTEVEKGLFRQDLFYRLNVFPIHIPPLRVRKEDIALLVQYFTEKFSRKVGRRIRRPHPDEIKKLAVYHWPGNVRELKHLVERAVILYDGNELKFSGLDQAAPPRRTRSELPLIPLAEFEREYVEKVLNAVGWKLSGPNSASSILKLKPTTLLYRMKKLGIKKPSPSTVLTNG